MSTEPRCCESTAEEIGPADFGLLCVRPPDEVQKVILRVLGEVVRWLTGAEIGSQAMEDTANHNWSKHRTTEEFVKGIHSLGDDGAACGAVEDVIVGFM